MRIALGVEYDGSGFSGWQRQPAVRTVENCVATAVGEIAGEPVKLVCSGRTDAGVHALAQVVHFDCAVHRPERAWVQGGNAHLPPDVRIRWARRVPDDFSARLSAVARRYRYLIHSAPVAPALRRGRVAWVRRPLSTKRMAAAAQHLIGEHDFSAFRAAACQARHPVRTLYRLDCRAEHDLLIVEATANAFLHHMVRNIVGSLIAVASGERQAEWLAAVLAGEDRTRAGSTAPAHGLYLAGASYPRRYAIPAYDGCLNFAGPRFEG